MNAIQFWSKVNQSTPSECWEWTASLDRSGYGQVRYGGRVRKAYRVAYELSVGQVPDGLELDHLCCNRLCCNPDHLEPVTHRENLVRSPTSIIARYVNRTHCDKGHPFSGENLSTLYRNGRPYRVCLACRRDRRKRLRA